MDFDSKDVKNCLQGLLRTGQNGVMKLYELKKNFKQQIGIDLHTVALKLNFGTETDLLKSFQEFEVYGCDLNTTVKCKEIDHISEMNRRSK